MQYFWLTNTNSSKPKSHLNPRTDEWIVMVIKSLAAGRDVSGINHTEVFVK